MKIQNPAEETKIGQHEVGSSPDETRNEKQDNFFEELLAQDLEGKEAA
ncbi:hypothetical protein N8588_00345 [Akkermansiaceae bacterium]|nr:hypothetical protein [Akkermansiaceae bacterium]MDB4392540.1 hypothetical protein [bacterium]